MISLILQLQVVLTIAFLLLAYRIVFTFLHYPHAPGARLAAFTHWWYIWKVWGGKFETWNIKEHARHGKIIRIGPKMYSIDDPEAVKLIYSVTSPMSKTKWYQYWGDPRVPNHNLFSATDGKFHAQMRRLVAHMYSMTEIKSYEPYVDNCVSILLDQFDRYAAGRMTIDLQHWMQCYAFDTIGEITYGHRIGFLESGGDDIDGIMKALEKNTEFCTFVALEFCLLPFLLAKLGNPNKVAETWTQRLSAPRQTTSAKEEACTRIAEDFSAKLERLREKNPRNYERYRGAQAATANAIAGSDTTSIALTAILYYLLKYPDTLAALRQEILEAVTRGQAASPITFDQAQSLPYLQAVIKEGMRLHSSTGLPMWRVVGKGGAKIAGTFFPEGSQVGINTWVAHYNQHVFGTDAHQFRPDRWLPEHSSPEAVAQMERYFIPFGAGTRTCIGKNISILEVSKAIPELVRRYEIELVNSDVEYVNYWFVKQKNLRVRLAPAIRSL